MQITKWVFCNENNIMNHFLPLFFRSLLANFFVMWHQVHELSMFPPQQMFPHSPCQDLQWTISGTYNYPALTVPWISISKHQWKWENFQTWSCKEVAPSHSSSNGISQLERTRNLPRKVSVSQNSHAVLAHGTILLLPQWSWKQGAEVTWESIGSSRRRKISKDWHILETFFQTLSRSHWVFHSQFYLGKNSQFINIIFWSL